jgi:hypothetical protein
MAKCKEHFISESTLRWLMQHDLATTPVNGWIELKRSIISYFTASEDVVSPGILRVPEETHSAQTLVALNLSPDTARKLFACFHDFKQHPENGGISILDYAKDYISSIRGDAIREDDDWVGIIKRIGLSKEFRGSLLEANFDGKPWYPRKSTLKEEVLQMMDDRFKELMSIDGKVREKYEEYINPRETWQAGLE